MKIKTLLYNPKEGCKITTSLIGSPKWNSYMEKGYLPIAEISGFNISLQKYTERNK